MKCALDINQRRHLYRSSFGAYPDTGHHVTKNTRINILVRCRPYLKENKNEALYERQYFSKLEDLHEGEEGDRRQILEAITSVFPCKINAYRKRVKNADTSKGIEVRVECK